MFIILFTIISAISAQTVYMYYVPKRSYNVQNRFGSNAHRLIFINGTKDIALYVKNSNKSTFPVLGNRLINNTNIHLYAKRNRAVGTKPNILTNAGIPRVPLKNTIVGSNEISGVLNIDKHNTEFYISEVKHKDDSTFLNSNESEDRSDISDFESEKVENTEELMFDDTKIKKNRNSLKSRLFEFYAKNKLLICFEIVLFTILFVLLFIKFELYIYIIKLYKKCFRKRRDTRIRYEPVDPEVEESPKVVNNSAN
ncbi:hypothetical protein COBT_003485, partial [Conglomerata obtusa]